MISRSLRIGVRLGLLAGLAVALLKLIQGRRASPEASMPSSPTPARRTPMGPPSNNTPLVEPTMLQSVSAKKAPAPPTGGRALQPEAEIAVSEPDRDEPSGPGPVPAGTTQDRPAPTKKAAKKASTAPVKRATARPARKTVKKGRAVAAWVEPPEGGSCPSTHPVKAKLTSGIYHLPGMVAYERTKPDRCYRDEAAAQGDGLRKAKR